MKATYDSEVDALYIQLLEGDFECRTIRLTEEIALDIGPDELLVGIEVLDAKKLIGKGEAPTMALENVHLVSV
jgi:uncharacterized protein YuzE